MSTSWLDELARTSPSPDLMAWARTQPDLETAWASCENLEWLIELSVARAVDDASQRALVVAMSTVLMDDPWFLRLRPAGFIIARAWALQEDANRLDLLGRRRLEDYQNACVIWLPPVIALMLVLQYHFVVPRLVLQLIRLLGLPALYVVAQAWGWARRALTARALGDYRFEFVERDVVRPARRLVRRASPSLQKRIAETFRRRWREAVARAQVPLNGAAS